MRCAEVGELMSLKLDGLAADDDVAELQAHLADCADCRLAWSALQEVSSLLETRVWVDPPAGFTERVMARVERRRSPRTIAGAMLLMAASALFSILALLPVLGMIILAWGVIGQTSAVAAIIRMLSNLAYAGSVLLGVALRLVKTLVESVPAPLLMLYPLMAVLLALAWVMVLSRAQGRMRVPS